MRKGVAALGAALGGSLLLPGAAAAHGLVGRSDLPIPEWLFGWAAAIVLIVSFVALAVLWPEPKLEGDRGWRRLFALPQGAVDAVCGTIGVFLFGVTIWAGLAGEQTSASNWTSTFIYVIFWLGFAAASVLFGDVFRAFNPWRAIGRATGALVGRRAPARRPYPEQLGRWPAAIGLLVFTWIELVGQWADTPSLLVTAAVGYTVVTFIAQAVWGVETWTRRGETFSVYYNLLSRISIFETRDRVVGVRPPLGGLPKLDTPPGTVAMVMVMIGTVTFDGLSQGALWDTVGTWLQDLFTTLGASVEMSLDLAGTIGLVGGVLLVAGFYWLGMEGARSVGGDLDAAHLRRVFVHTLVPIACVYVLAHYISYLVHEGQAIQYLASDPFGQGWDIFGTAEAAVNYSVLSQTALYWIWLGLVIVGHVAALILAHDRALATYGQVAQAVRSQYWMLSIMIGFTMLALWLLYQAGR